MLSVLFDLIIFPFNQIDSLHSLISLIPLIYFTRLFLVLLSFSVRSHTKKYPTHSLHFQTDKTQNQFVISTLTP